MEEQSNKWSPKEIRKTIFAISGILAIFSGIYLFLNQTKADGNLKFNFVGFSGEVQSGSAGIFIGFFGVILVLVSLIPYRTKENVQIDWNFFLRKDIITILITSILLIVFVVVYLITLNPVILPFIVLLIIPFIKLSDAS